jgi:hypothetical protein
MPAEVARAIRHLFDPIHIRPSYWRPAWQEILGCKSGAKRDGGGRLEGLKLYFTPPERSGSSVWSGSRRRRVFNCHQAPGSGSIDAHLLCVYLFRVAFA